MPRRSDAKAGPILSANELRLGKPRKSQRGEGCGRKQPTPELPPFAKPATPPNLPWDLGNWNVQDPGIAFALECPMAGDKRFVYVLKNTDDAPQFYVGLTSDVKARLVDHNAGRCPHTPSRRTWQLHVAVELPDEERAIRFER